MARSSNLDKFIAAFGAPSDEALSASALKIEFSYLHASRVVKQDDAIRDLFMASATVSGDRLNYQLQPVLRYESEFGIHQRLQVTLL